MIFAGSVTGRVSSLWIISVQSDMYVNTVTITISTPKTMWIIAPIWMNSNNHLRLIVRNAMIR